MEFRVWAPEARSVQVQAGSSRVAMQATERGWWRAEVEEAGPGADYAYLLDSSGPFPDPRSAWQPQGVDGPSRVVDHAAFAWSDDRWQAPPLHSGVLYELHIGTFTPEGTFEAAIARLPHLNHLGITHIELMPVNEFPGDWGWGYDGVDLYAPHHAYGGPQGLKRFIDACHAAGLAVLLDVVYNHLGPRGNYLARFGPYFTNRYTTPWGGAVNLDGEGSEEVRRFLCDNAILWLRDYHFDGLRLDATHAIFDMSALHFLEQLTREVGEIEAHLGRHLVVTAESDLNDPRLVTAPEAGGYGIRAQWNEDFHHALHAALTGERSGYYSDFGSLGDVARAWKRAYVYDGRRSEFRHRRQGRPAGDLPGGRFIGFLQNHDQVGNRARGERSSMLMSVGRLKIGAALVLCAPFIPLLFQGEEFAATTPFFYFINYHDPELARAVSEGRRRQFAAFGGDAQDAPDPQSPATFHESKLRWCETDGRSRDMLEWYRRLIALRRAEPELTDGRLDRVEARFSEEESWLVLRRGGISVACNLRAGKQAVPLEDAGAVLLSSAPECCVAGREALLAADSVAIIKHNGV